MESRCSRGTGWGPLGQVCPPATCQAPGFARGEGCASARRPRQGKATAGAGPQPEGPAACLCWPARVPCHGRAPAGVVQRGSDLSPPQQPAEVGRATSMRGIGAQRYLPQGPGCWLGLPRVHTHISVHMCALGVAPRQAVPLERSQGCCRHCWVHGSRSGGRETGQRRVQPLDQDHGWVALGQGRQRTAPGRPEPLPGWAQACPCPAPAWQRVGLWPQRVPSCCLRAHLSEGLPGLRRWMLALAPGSDGMVWRGPAVQHRMQRQSGWHGQSSCPARWVIPTQVLSPVGLDRCRGLRGSVQSLSPGSAGLGPAARLLVRVEAHAQAQTPVSGGAARPGGCIARAWRGAGRPGDLRLPGGLAVPVPWETAQCSQ